MNLRAFCGKLSPIIVPLFVLSFFIALSSGFSTRSAGILIDDLSGGLSKNWKTKSFKGTTEYRIDSENGSPCIRAVSKGSASALYYPIEFDPARYPFISWRWKIEGTLLKGDARKKSGDDYAARVYVVFPSVFFWKTRALNYIWANRLPRGEAVPNAYTSNACMIALESGNQKAGQWVEEERNIVEDFRRCFGEDPPEAGAVAIMTDTDDTGGEAEACYGIIRLLPRKE